MSKKMSALNITWMTLLATLLGVALPGCNGSGTPSTDSRTNLPAANLKSTNSKLALATPTNAIGVDYAYESLIMTSLGLSLSDQTLSFADLVSKFAVKNALKAREDIVCVNGGTLAWRWVDSDNNAEVSVGDSAVILMRDCTLIRNTYKGTVTVNFVAPTHNSNYDVC